MLGVLDSVSSGHCCTCTHQPTSYHLLSNATLLHERNRANAQTAAEDHDAQTLEAINLVRKGFADLGAVNPELAYGLIMDVLGGIRS